ncbi:zinc-finger domain-containing protein [Laribacter hongkongensis]|uniref:zinc-finger domain-containing protein n=1 Tax=Laribacter hongkongensis TaxID=168471 RepID=UPI001EFEE9C3|nr:zinc-finger domain-containing protein [Laribacter hongkongensis]MCG9116571.1 zinc-finger domain-containing protein [Laribacter hongkongensis]
MTEHKDLRANFIEITATDLPLQCPMPSMSKWNAHPRVYLPIIKQHGHAKCPYCGTEYKLVGPLLTGHH